MPVPVRVALATVVVLVACRQRKHPIETPVTSGDSGTEQAVEPSASIAKPGVYRCSLQMAERTFAIESCAIREPQTLVIEGAECTLTATLSPAEYGFALEGSLRVDADSNEVKAELYQQGNGNFAAILRPGGTGLVRLTMLAESEPTTSR